MNIYVNIRHQYSELTGLQRYTSQLLSRFGSRIVPVAPTRGLRNRIGGHVWEQFALPKLVGSGDLLFSPANTGPLITTKQVVTIHDVFPLDHPELMTHRFSAWYRFLSPRLARRVSHVITVSEFSKQRLLTHVPIDESRITVIPNGVDSKFRPMTESELAVYWTSLGLPCRRYVLCVGSLEPRKNISRLLWAWTRVLGTVPNDIWLVLTGKREAASLFADSGGLPMLPPRVHLTGHVADRALPGLYAGATVFAFPSLYEGFGLTPLEAMAAGVPVLTGDQTALYEVVGNAGVMVNPYDVDAIADGLERLIEDSALRASLRAKGLERAKQFSWDLTAERTWTLLREAANG